MLDVMVYVKVFSRPERYNGQETGRTQWVCEPTRAVFNPPARGAWNPFGAVLGRDGSREAAIEDFVRRAASESYANLIVVPE
jgi:hypothetical protein